EGADAQCFSPLSFTGKVTDSMSNAPIANARLVARDANNAAVSRVALSAADGTYSLIVPATRDKNGVPLKAEYTIRCDAIAYQTFPTAPRVALPIDVSTASGNPLSVHTAATDIALIKLTNATGLGSISGNVGGDIPGGTLIVAGGSTGIADLDGDYA